MLLILVGCTEPGPRAATLEALAFQPEEYDGERVVTSGVVREFDTTEALRHHAVVEDASQNRVELLPLEAALPYVDERVTVVGRFSFDEETGRRIDVDSIEPTSDG